MSEFNTCVILSQSAIRIERALQRNGKRQIEVAFDDAGWEDAWTIQGALEYHLRETRDALDRETRAWFDTQILVESGFRGWPQ